MLLTSHRQPNGGLMVVLSKLFDLVFVATAPDIQHKTDDELLTNCCCLAEVRCRSERQV
jgi:hypothetical protein